MTSSTDASQSGSILIRREPGSDGSGTNLELSSGTMEDVGAATDDDDDDDGSWPPTWLAKKEYAGTVKSAWMRSQLGCLSLLSSQMRVSSSKKPCMRFNVCSRQSSSTWRLRAAQMRQPQMGQSQMASAKSRWQ